MNQLDKAGEESKLGITLMSYQQSFEWAGLNCKMFAILAPYFRPVLLAPSSAGSRL